MCKLFGRDHNSPQVASLCKQAWETLEQRILATLSYRRFAFVRLMAGGGGNTAMAASCSSIFT